MEPTREKETSQTRQNGDRPDDGGSIDLRNIGKLIPVYTALQLRREPTSQSLPWEPQVINVLGA
jgi:hypothetical protein